jgi:D-lactate dehydrogenase
MRCFTLYLYRLLRTHLNSLLSKILPESRIRTRFIDLVSFASDAGFYYLIPRAVVQPINEEEVRQLLTFSREQKIPIVFRTGGSSLSGQSITDGLLVDLSQYWNKIKVEDDGAMVRVQPGITGAMVNAHLKRFQRKIGPDPSSISAAMMGGIISNNASGMCCGVKMNSYHTTKYIRFILPDGKIFSTEIQGDYSRFQVECPELYATLIDLKSEVVSNNNLFEKIRKKYKTKTTVGYSLNALIDYDHPLDILAHLLVGAEGTLAFISEAVLETVPDYPFKSTALLYFPSIYAACQAIVPLTDAGAMMVELMDRASLHAVENLAGMPSVVKSLPESAAALLIEFQENSKEALELRVRDFLSASSQISMLNEPEFTTDPVEQDFLWKVRKGLFPAVGAVRASGTTVILEDIAFPVAKLGDAILELQDLFKKFHYDNAIIFGHAKDGNIHFVVTQSFGSEAEVDRYDRFMREVITMVVSKYDGTLKAEHGTGRNMAPFVETEWGGDAYRIIRKIKQAIDPNGLLNPGVIVNDDKNAHVKNLKNLPTVEEEVDRCIECGYCEHKCPSRDITTTPRRRIVVRRVLQDLKSKGDTANYNLLLQQYQYDGIDTCAVDGLCATACPVDINTGDLVKRLRRENHSVTANKIALFVATNFGATVGAVRFTLNTGSGINRIFGSTAMNKITRGLRKILPAIPLWSQQLANAPRLHALKSATGGKDTMIVYFPSCISRTMGTYAGEQKNAVETFLSICEKTNVGVKIVDNVSGACCSQIFSSKGFSQAYQHTANKIVDQLFRSTNEGLFPVVIDVSSCAYTLHQLRPVLSSENKIKFDKLKVLDAVDFLHDMVVPNVEAKHKLDSVVLHPVCSLQKMKIENKLTRIAQAFAGKVTVPKNAGCCGMAGDRGFLFPELTDSATHQEGSEVRGQKFSGYYSSTKTCEMALTEATRENYKSILYLVDKCI